TAVLPSFNELTSKTLDATFLLEPEVLIIGTGMLILIGVLAGAYPAAMMSSFSPIKTLKNYIHRGRESNALRKGLVVFQFTMSIILIAGTILIMRQMNFLQNQNLGLAKDQVVELLMRNTVSPKYQLIKDEMAKVPGVTMTSVNNFSYREGVSNIALLPEGAQENEVTSE